MDANLQAKKATRANTVRVTLSNRRYKSFLFQTRKKLREETPIECENLYINDHLTLYNHKILIGLKTKRRTFSRENDPFKSIYTHDGRVFCKLIKDGEREGIHIKTPEDMIQLLQSLTSGAAVPQQQSDDSSRDSTRQ